MSSISASPTIVVKSERVIVVDKAGGWLSVPSREGAADERPCVGRVLERDHGRVWPVHRLDQEATGLLLFARDAEAHRLMSRWFERRLIHKTYEAWTCGDPAADVPQRGPEATCGGDAVVWRCRMARGKKRAYLADFGKDSVTIARWMDDTEWNGRVCRRWEMNPETGRSHQLRLELARRGFPIVGDTLYGSSLSLAPSTIALRAVALDLRECLEASRLGLSDMLRIGGIREVLS